MREADMGPFPSPASPRVYGGPQGVRALDHVDVSLAEGEFIGPARPLRLRQVHPAQHPRGFEAQTDGAISFDGRPVKKPGPNRGVVFQEAALLPWLTVWLNVFFGPQVQGVAKADYEPRAREIIRVVGLESFMEALPVQLSRHAPARGHRPRLVMQPKALLMDERSGAGRADPALHAATAAGCVALTFKTTVLFVTQ